MNNETKKLDSTQDVVQPQPVENKGPLLRPRFVPAKPEEIVIDPEHSVAGVFVIKFVEGSHVRLDPDGLMIDEKAILSNAEEERRLARVGLKPATAAVELKAVSEILRGYRDSHRFDLGYAFRPAGFVYSPDHADADTPFREKDQLEQRAGEELADLDLYYVVFAKDFKEADVQQNLMNELNAFRIVEQVYAAMPSEGAQVPPTPDLSSQQGYLRPAPGGLDALYAWTRSGGRGEGVRLIDVEYDWVTDHEDFPPASQMFWGGRGAGPYDGGGSGHGTAVMGIIAAPANGFGITGFAPGIQYGLSSVFRAFDYIWAAIVATFSGEHWAGRTHNVAVANSIQVAADQLRPGDILLIEQHTMGPVEGRWVAMEYYQECFDVIRRTTARGVIVVEAAGNGSQNLDTTGYGSRFAPNVRHSGALLVGGSGPGDNMPNGSTNSSQRVEVHAWGAGVVTLGYGIDRVPPFDAERPISRLYRNSFSGTSSASAIIAGAVACLQGARRATGRPPLTPIELANLLRSTGTRQQGTREAIDLRPIGVQPNLRAAIDIAVASTGGFTGAGFYTIRSRSSGKVLDIDLDFFRGQDNGQRLLQFDFHGGRNQQFEVVGIGPFVIYPRHTRNKVLDVAGASTADGAALQQWQQHSGANQSFRIEPVGGFYRIVAVHSGKVLDVPGFSRDRVGIQQWRWNGGDNQLFEFMPIR